MKKWISSEDKLPNNENYVLTYSKNHHPCVSIGFYSNINKRWLKCAAAYPTHWKGIDYPDGE